MANVPGMPKCYKAAIYGCGYGVEQTLADALRMQWDCHCSWAVVAEARWEMLVCFSRKGAPQMGQLFSFAQGVCDQARGSMTIDNLGREVTEAMLAFIHRLNEHGRIGSYPRCLQYQINEYAKRRNEQVQRDDIAMRIGHEPTPHLCLQYHERIRQLLEAIIQFAQTDRLCAAMIGNAVAGLPNRVGG